MRLVSSFLYLTLVVFSTAASPDTRLLGDLPLDVLRDLLSIFINGTVYRFGDCRKPTDSFAPLTEYWIYTRNNLQNPTIVTQSTLDISPGDSKFIFIAHGWSASANTGYIQGIKDAYLSRYDAYVVLINWEAYSMLSYYAAYCEIQSVAVNVASFINQIKQTYNVSLSELHLVGHSMGAQMFGVCGRNIYHAYGEKLGRITGLDPAAPLFETVESSDRLDPSDAVFVDVIHTSVGLIGYLGSCGHIDSYANCGYYQPGCVKFAINQDVFQNISQILHLPVDIVTCSHDRSCNYFEESILSDNFVASKCIGCGLPVCIPNILDKERKIVGEDCTGPGEVQDYIFQTRSSSPFAKG